MMRDTTSDGQLFTKKGNKNYTSDSINGKQSKVPHTSNENWGIAQLALIGGSTVLRMVRLRTLTVM